MDAVSCRSVLTMVRQSKKKCWRWLLLRTLACSSEIHLPTMLSSLFLILRWEMWIRRLAASYLAVSSLLVSKNTAATWSKDVWRILLIKFSLRWSMSYAKHRASTPFWSISTLTMLSKKRFKSLLSRFSHIALNVLRLTCLKLRNLESSVSRSIKDYQSSILS